MSVNEEPDCFQNDNTSDESDCLEYGSQYDEDMTGKDLIARYWISLYI